MGVNLGQNIPRTEIELKDLANRDIAIDAFNTLYQFLSTIRQMDGTPLKDSKGNVTSHLSGLFYRGINLLEAGINPIFVFDGKAPEFKLATQSARRAVKEEAQDKWKEALKTGDMKEARKYASQTSRLTSSMIDTSKDLIEAVGMSWIQAPSEGEAEAAFLCKEREVYAAASQDYDALLFGSPILVRNITVSGKRRLPGKKTLVDVKPEIIKLEDVLKSNELTQEQMISIGILVGTDYNPGGVEGIGPKRAYDLVKKHEIFDEIFSNVDWNFDIEPSKIRDFFLNPPVQKLTPVKGKFNEDLIKEILCEKHEFSEARIDKGIERIRDARNDGQTSLGKWFKK